MSAHFAARVRISHVHPERSVVSKHAPNLTEHAHHIGDVPFWRGFESQLRVDTHGTAFSANKFFKLPIVSGFLGIFQTGRVTVEPFMITPLGISAFPRCRAVVAQAPVRRTRYATLHALAR